MGDTDNVMALPVPELSEKMSCGHSLSRLVYRCETCDKELRASLAAANERAERAEAENRVLREFFATAEPALCDCNNPDSCDAPICLSRKKVITEIKDILHLQEAR